VADVWRFCFTVMDMVGGRSPLLGCGNDHGGLTPAALDCGDDSCRTLRDPSRTPCVIWTTAG